MIGRALLVLAVVIVSALTYPGALITSLTARMAALPDTSGGPAGVLPWLHVAHPSGGRPYIADDQNRVVLLHGVIPASLVEYGITAAQYPIDPTAYAGGRCPAPITGNPYPPLCEVDLQAMAKLGFNSVRLPISWSVLEPERGTFNTTYVDRIAQVVGWARTLGMYVIVDMHQNAYSHYMPPGIDVKPRYLSGAPRWATFTDGFPSRVYHSQRELNAAVFEATTNFWYDRAGIQDEYIRALAFVAKRFVDDSAVAGYGIYNEPWPGWNLPPGFEDLLLFPFYRRVIDALTGLHDGAPCWTGFFMPAVCGYPDLNVHDRRHLMFLDTGLVREVTDFPTHLGLPVSSYPNLVLALHAYTHIYTIDKLIGQKPANAGYPWGGYDQSYAAAQQEARAMRAALFVAEFGNDPGDEDALLLPSQLAEQERHYVGFAFWTWKENDSGGWGMFDPNADCMRHVRASLLARVYPRLTADTAADFAYDAATGAFTMHASGRAGQAATEVYIPPSVTGEVTGAGGVRITVTAQPDGSRLAIGVPTGGGFTVAVSAAPLSPQPCPIQAGRLMDIGPGSG